MDRIICVIPTYNEVQNIELLLTQIEKNCPQVDVLVVDDHSPDGTANIIKKNKLFGKKIFLIQREKKMGLGTAYTEGFHFVIKNNYDYAVQMDADFSHRVEDLVVLIQTSAKNRKSVIVGSRWMPGGNITNWSLLRRMISYGGNLFARLMLGSMLGSMLGPISGESSSPTLGSKSNSASLPAFRPIYDWTGGFNLWPVDVLKKCVTVKLESHGYAFQIEMKYIALGLKFLLIEVPIVFEERKFGDSKMSLRIIGEAFWKVIGFKKKILYIFLLTIIGVGSSWDYCLAQGDMATEEDLARANQKNKKAKKKSIDLDEPAQDETLNKSDSEETDTDDVKAKTKTKPKKKDQGQDGKVKVDGAPIYEAANFDSPAFEYLEIDKKVKISKKIYPGPGGLGAFYKVRVTKGKYGYIADSDVQLLSKTNRNSKSLKNLNKGTPSVEDPQGFDGGDPTVLMSGMDDEPTDPTGNSFLTEKVLGLALSSYNYAEKIANNKKSSPTSLFGVKISGSTGLMGGAPMDLSFLITSTAPGFYDNIANDTSGFMFMSHALIMVPMKEWTNGAIYYGFGIMGRYSKWDVALKSQAGNPAIGSEELAWGLAGELGFAWRIARSIVIRLEGKYIYEQESYIGYDAAFQFKF